MGYKDVRASGSTLTKAIVRASSHGYLDRPQPPRRADHRRTTRGLLSAGFLMLALSGCQSTHDSSGGTVNSSDAAVDARDSSQPQAADTGGLDATVTADSSFDAATDTGTTSTDAIADAGPDASDGADVAAPTCPVVTVELVAPQPTIWQISEGGDYGTPLSLGPTKAGLEANPCAQAFVGPDQNTIVCSTCQEDPSLCGPQALGLFFSPLATSATPSEVTQTFPWMQGFYASGTCGSSQACIQEGCAPAGSYVAQFCACPSSTQEGCIGLLNDGGALTCVSATFQYPAASKVTVKLPSVTVFAVGGTVSGLPSASSLVLSNDATCDSLNPCETTTIDANGSFKLAQPLRPGESYSVSVATSPPGYTCSVSSPSGTIANAAITNISVTCAPGGPTDAGTSEAGPSDSAAAEAGD